ncbi:hypothetical protein J6590_069327 [Homalodisca vitripennis]|nr:hypothetical protein J6590_069327 [Homalodisca vitripennis]
MSSKLSTNFVVNGRCITWYIQVDGSSYAKLQIVTYCTDRAMCSGISSCKTTLPAGGLVVFRGPCYVKHRAKPTPKAISRPTGCRPCCDRVPVPQSAIRRGFSARLRGILLLYYILSGDHGKLG